MRDFERHVRANLADPLPIDGVARTLGTTRRTLERRVRAAAGMTPLELIQRIRAQRAEHLLATTEESIDQVAATVGYRNGSTLRALLLRYRRQASRPRIEGDAPAALVSYRQGGAPSDWCWPLYGVLVVIWSSTWVAIKIGLEDTPPLLGAGLRFALAGVALLVVASAWGRGRASARARLRTDPVLAGTLALLPFATTYGLIYWGEQYVPSGLAAVLFGVLPLYSAALVAVALREEPLSRRLLFGITVAIAGVALAFSESVELGDARWAAPAAVACAIAPMAAAVGTIAQKRRGARLDAVALNGWAMLAGGVLLLAASAISEDWARAAWSAAVGRLDRVPGGLRLRDRLRAAEPVDPRAAGGDDVLHRAGAAVRRAGLRRGDLRRGADAAGRGGCRARGGRTGPLAVAGAPRRRGGRLRPRLWVGLRAWRHRRSPRAIPPRR